MERVTLRLPKKHIEKIEQKINAGIYKDRSEAIRDAIRKQIIDN